MINAHLFHNNIKFMLALVAKVRGKLMCKN